ncbi:hypothetical protein AH4AK4_0013 [Aeromonas hydrophila 4AK4]|nr:hypothetical protein AH4AK4_0013 [Aeromonas hydrophila 4AK4]
MVKITTYGFQNNQQDGQQSLKRRHFLFYLNKINCLYSWHDYWNNSLVISTTPEQAR